METKIFESHNLEDKNLPFIFHFDVCLPNCSNLLNWHNNIEILYFTEGSGTVRSGAVTQAVKAGDLFVINSNVLHSTYTSDILKYYCLIADTDFCRQNSLFTDETDYKGLVISEEARKLYCNVISEFNSENQYRTAGIKSSVLQLIVYLTRNFSEYEPIAKPGKPSNDENIKFAIGYIRSHFDQHLTLEEIARAAKLSKYYFSREFKSITGLSPITFLNSIRCDNAKKLLSLGKYTIHKTAIKCGFENDSYFSETFKKHTGYLPSKYLQKAK